MEYFLAVDGGGTKTHFALYDARAETVDLIQFGATNHEVLAGGFSEMREHLREMTGRVLKKNDLSCEDIRHSVWGMAGLDTESQHKIIHGFISEMGFERFTLCGDSDLGIKASWPEGYGICLVNGTGVNVVGINERRERYQIGGIPIMGDFGGSVFMGEQTIKTVYRNLFRHRRETILTKMVMNLYQLDSRHEFTDRVMDWANSKKLPIPNVVKCLFDAAYSGDEEAVALLERMSNEYALNVKTLLEELPFAESSIHIALVGSLFTMGLSEIHLRSLEKNLKLYIPEKEFIMHILKRPPVAGALAWALKEGGIADSWTRAMACFPEHWR